MIRIDKVLKISFINFASYTLNKWVIDFCNIPELFIDIAKRIAPDFFL